MGTLASFLRVDQADPSTRVRLEQEGNALGLIEDLRRRREDELGWTQKEVARRMGRHQSVVSTLERLGSDPRWSSVRRYASAMGVVIEYSLSYEHLGADLTGLVNDVEPDSDVDPTAVVQKRAMRAA